MKLSPERRSDEHEFRMLVPEGIPDTRLQFAWSKLISFDRSFEVAPVCQLLGSWLIPSEGLPPGFSAGVLPTNPAIATFGLGLATIPSGRVTELPPKYPTPRRAARICSAQPLTEGGPRSDGHIMITANRAISLGPRPYAIGYWGGMSRTQREVGTSPRQLASYAE